MNIVKELRKKKGIQQKELAIIIGVAQPTISEWETNKKDPSGENLKKLAEYFNVDGLMILGKGIINLTGKSNFPRQERATDGFDQTGVLPDYETAAVKAAETLIRYHVAAAPVLPLAILQSMPDVSIVSFTEMADRSALDGQIFVTLFGAENQDAITITSESAENTRFIVAYNQNLPFYMLQRALARELGHIVLGHSAPIPLSVRTAEALFFARHLLCPRPMIRAIQETGVKLTVKMFGNITGCYGRFIAGLRQTPGVYVQDDLNRLVKAQFSNYVANFHYFQTIIANDDDSSAVDFGSYMDNYEE